MSFRIDRIRMQADLAAMARAVLLRGRREKLQQPRVDRSFVLVFDELECAFDQ